METRLTAEIRTVNLGDRVFDRGPTGWKGKVSRVNGATVEVQWTKGELIEWDDWAVWKFEWNGKRGGWELWWQV